MSSSNGDEAMVSVGAGRGAADGAGGPVAIVFGCAGPRLSDAERAFFRAVRPFGFILFKRNCVDPGQLRMLVADLREAAGRPAAPVLIDQEGGRVSRLPAPPWPRFPSARQVGAAAGGIAPGDGDDERAAWLYGRLLAASLLPLGITVDCVPVCDVPVAGAHDVIGDRAFSGRPEVVARLAAVAVRGLVEGGVLPVVKHLPGHGRARADSHKELPVVEASVEELEASDFLPFRALAAAPLGMVAHVRYLAFDAEQPASTSSTVIEAVIRGRLGFSGFLFSDDIAMGALAGTPGERVAAVLDAGCDCALHCTGVLADMESAAGAGRPLTVAAWERWRRAEACLPVAPVPIDEAACWHDFNALIGG